MGGAYLLAKALHESTDYQQTFERYEEQLYASVQAEQKSGRRFAKSFLPGSPLGLFVQQAMMKVLLRPAFRSLLRRQLHVESLFLVPARRKLCAARKIARCAPTPVICW
jgi:2-polyprenyl-6-methoxyphenol hydroxylase-like FAD-dependent oxidoreductase